jgi:hypothetical protein
MKNRFLTYLLFALTINSFSQSDSKPKIMTTIENGSSIAYFNSKLGLVGARGKKIIPFEYETLEYKNGCLIAQKIGKYGLLTLDNKIIVPCKYDLILARDNDNFIVILDDLKGVIDKTSKELIPTKYKSIDTFQKDFYIVQNEEDLNGIYDFKGASIVPENYVFFNIDKNRIFCTDKTKNLIIDVTDSKKNSLLPDNIVFKKHQKSYIAGELFNQIFSVNNKFGLMKSDATILIPALYDDLTNFYNSSVFIAKLNDKYGIVNYQNKIVREIKYDKIELKKEHAVLKTKGNKEEFYEYGSPN